MDKVFVAVAVGTMIALTLQGCGGSSTTTTTTTTTAPAACEPMKPSDPCWQKSHANSTAAFCKGLGAIGCDGKNCTLMAENGSVGSHCMTVPASTPAPTPAPPAACEPMKPSDPCEQKCHANCTAAICEGLGAIGCDGKNCTLMGENGSVKSQCMTVHKVEALV